MLGKSYSFPEETKIKPDPQCHSGSGKCQRGSISEPSPYWGSPAIGCPEVKERITIIITSLLEAPDACLRAQLCSIKMYRKEIQKNIKSGHS